MKKIIIYILILFFSNGIAFSETYLSKEFKYSLKYDENWKKIYVPDPTSDVFLICESDLCDETANISVSVNFDNQLKRIKVEKFLELINSEILTRMIRNTPRIENFKIVDEFISKFNNRKFFNVIVSYTMLPYKSVRIRHMHVTIDSGFIYNIVLHTSPDYYKHDYDLAKKVIKTVNINN